MTIVELGKKLKAIEDRMKRKGHVRTKDCLVLPMMDCAMTECLCEWMNTVTHERHFETSLSLKC